MCSKLLNEMQFYTIGEQEARAWTISSAGNGTTAVEAAAKIHSDIAAGFVRAEVMSSADFMKYGGEDGVRAAGKLRSEQKEYIVQDGDIMHFRHQQPAAKKK